ncbi:MAG: hypothetical protein SNJ77_05200 [Cytophagales bacterium]
MFTSRAEFRIMLRQDNADVRLSEKAYQMGSIDGRRFDKTQKKIELAKELEKLYQQVKLDPELVNPWLEAKESSTVKEKISVYNLLKRPNIEIEEIINQFDELKSKMKDYNKDEIEYSSINIKYESYIEKERNMANRMKELENLKIPDSFDFKKITVLSNEAKEKLTRIRPETIGQASRISGISPSDVSIVMLHLTR